MAGSWASLCSQPGWSMLSHSIAARSAHPGGVNALLCDGSTRFVKDGVDVRIWQAVGTRNGKEVVSTSDF
jgi:prepilin-type processing-associated H-X9-DG protein